MFCRAECWQYDERYHWTGLGLNSISNSIREIEKFNQGWKYRSAITIYIDQYQYNNPLYFWQILMIGKMFWKQSLSWNKYSARYEIWNSISCHPAFFQNFAVGQIEEFNWITFSIWHKIWGVTLAGWTQWSIIQSLHWSSGFQCCFMRLRRDDKPQISRVNLVWWVLNYNILLREFCREGCWEALAGSYWTLEEKREAPSVPLAICRQQSRKFSKV